MKTLIGIVAIVGLSGCAGMGAVCDSVSISAKYSHISHPLAGRPFAAGKEEDFLDAVGPVGRCHMGRTTISGDLGYKVGSPGFLGPDLVGGVSVEVMLWKSQ